MEAYLFLAGEIIDYSPIKDIIKFEENIYCADGGANHLIQLGLKPKLILGDFDSILPSTKEIFKSCQKITFPSHKDFSDGELLIKEVYDKFDKIYVFGALGGRVDHSYFNLHFLEKYPKCTLIHGDELIYYLDKNSQIENKRGKRISFLPLDRDNIVSLQGFLYNLDKRSISRGEGLTLSNEITSDLAKVTILKGSFLCTIEL